MAPPELKPEAKGFPRVVVGGDQQYREVDNRRLTLGILFAVLAGAIVIIVCAGAWYGLDRLDPKEDLRMFLARIITHAVVSIALVFFAYSLLRAAERMFVPHFLLIAEGEPVEKIRAILGINTPMKAALEAAKGLKEIVQSVVPGMAAAAGEKEKE